MNPRKIVIRALLAISLVGCLFVMSGGCDQIEKVANDVNYIAGGSGGAPPAAEPTTQRSAAVETGRAVVTIAGAASPAVKQIAGIVAVLSGAVAGFAGHFATKRSGQKRLGTVVAELLDDVATFKQPDVSWSKATETVLARLGHAHAYPDLRVADMNRPIEDLIE